MFRHVDGTCRTFFGTAFLRFLAPKDWPFLESEQQENQQFRPVLTETALPMKRVLIMSH